MKAVIVGCGRVGAALADHLDRDGHEVIILDLSTAAFDRLPSTFGGTAVRGDGTDEDVLRRAGAEGADLFLSLTEGDNRNILAAQMALEAFGVERVIAKVNDPVRAEAYAHLGIATLCRTMLMTDGVLGYLGFPVPSRPAVLEGTPHRHLFRESPPAGAAEAAEPAEAAPGADAPRAADAAQRADAARAADAARPADATYPAGAAGPADAATPSREA